MARPEIHTRYQQEQLARLDKAEVQMEREGIPRLSTPFRAILDARAKLRLDLGFRLPRPTLSLLRLYGLSPGEITVWLDAELGYFTEARAKPGAPPVYHHVTDGVAMSLLKGELTKELEAELMKPDEYLGE